MAETSKQAVVRVERLSKHFGQGTARVDALVDINLEVYPGQVVGLIGPSGSGKTTLLNCIACILEPSSGRITLDGEVVYDDRWLKSDLRRLRLDKIGFIFQYPNLLPFLDGSDNVAVVLHLAGFKRRRGARARRSSCSTISRSATASMPCPSSFPAAKANGWRSRGHSPTGRASSSRTSRPRRSIQLAPGSSWICCAGSPSIKTPPSSW